eukprot:SAG31_NODE_36248_length_315_cov_0.717593_1_plen_56_part_01
MAALGTMNEYVYCDRLLANLKGTPVRMKCRARKQNLQEIARRQDFRRMATLVVKDA